jgi:MraZ protein
MFGGENLSTIDGKGRTSIPAKFRETLVEVYGDERFIITKATPVDFGDGSYGRGLSVYPVTEWRQLEQKILANEGGFTSVQLNSIKRQVLAPAVECSADKLGRVLIPPALRVHAGLERDIWFVGMGRRFDVWSKETYGRVNAQDEKNFPQESEALAALGI